MKAHIFLSLIFISILSFSNRNENVIIVQGKMKPLNLNKYTYLYSTQDTSSDISTVLDKKFIPTPDGLNVGVNTKIRWERFRFYNPSNKTKKYYIYFPYNHINKIVAYTFNEQQAVDTSYAGTYYNNQKTIKSRGYPILLELKPGETEVYIYVNHLFLPLRGISYLVNSEQLRDSNYNSENAIWFWKGVFLFAMLVTFALFLSTRLKLFLYYFLLNLGVGIFFATEIGDFFIFFDVDHLNNIIDIKHFGNIIILFAFPLFINEIIPVSKLLPKTWKYLFYGIFPIPFLWTLCMIPAFKQSYLLYFTTQYFIFGSAIIFVLQLYFAFIAFRHKSKNSLAVLIAYTF